MKAQANGSGVIKRSIIVAIISSTLCFLNDVVAASEVVGPGQADNGQLRSGQLNTAQLNTAQLNTAQLNTDELSIDQSNADQANADPESTDAENAGQPSKDFESQPRFEFGLATALLQVPAYPASDVTNDRQFLVPWFIYRSDNVQVKDGGVKLVAYESDNLIIDLGVSGSLSSDASETPLRDGMPDLDFLLELGPRFNVPLSDTTSDGIRSRLNWITSLRLAFSTDFGSIDYRGPVLNSEISYRKSGYFDKKLSFNASASTTWLGEELMEYFFSVDREFATATRPEFNASAGYLNVGASLGISYKATSNINTFIGLGVKSYSGSKNEDSPLFETETNTSIIAALSWRLYKSKRVVTVRDE